MNDYVFSRFPQHSETIQALRPKIAGLFEACSNYEEICTWLATQKQNSAARNPGELDQARDLKRDLENEILDLLENHNDITK